MESLLDRRLNASNVNKEPEEERPDRGDDTVVGTADDGDAPEGDKSGGTSSPPDLLRTFDASLAMRLTLVTVMFGY